MFPRSDGAWALLIGTGGIGENCCDCRADPAVAAGPGTDVKFAECLSQRVPARRKGAAWLPSGAQRRSAGIPAVGTGVRRNDPAARQSPAFRLRALPFRRAQRALWLRTVVYQFAKSRDDE